MKKILLFLSIAFLSTGSLMAQDKKQHGAHDGHNHDAPVAAVPAVTRPAESIAFPEGNHNFGTITEGPNADHEFAFSNTGKEPIVIERVQASCGCTTPSYTKEPVAPGKTGTVKASYSTMGRPGSFTKSLTVFYKVGDNPTSLSKTLTISGNVEKAPSSSVPENSSMMKLN